MCNKMDQKYTNKKEGNWVHIDRHTLRKPSVHSRKTHRFTWFPLPSQLSASATQPPSTAVPPLSSSSSRARSMARSLSNLVFKGLSFSGSAARPATIAPASFYLSGLRYNTSVPNEPDTHDDFKPTNKLESSDLCLKDLVEKDVKDNPVMLYMKGVPELPQCGFSSLAVRVLKLYEVPLASRNILEDPELKSAVKAFSHWPTFPQIFIKGEFVGGSDIILNMHQSGELKEKLKDITGSQEKKSE